jgi:hypothetical protein
VSISVSTHEKLKCAERELKMRQRVYPRFVENGKMKQWQADYEIKVMQAIIDDYRAQVEKENLI